MRKSIGCVRDVYGISRVTAGPDRLHKPSRDLTSFVQRCQRMAKDVKGCSRNLHPSCIPPAFLLQWTCVCGSVRTHQTPPCYEPGSLGVEGTLDGQSPAVQDVGVDHGGLDILVPEQLLDGSDIVAAFQEM